MPRGGPRRGAGRPKLASPLKRSKRRTNKKNRRDKARENIKKCVKELGRLISRGETESEGFKQKCHEYLRLRDFLSLNFGQRNLLQSGQNVSSAGLQDLVDHYIRQNVHDESSSDDDEVCKNDGINDYIL